MKLQFGTARPGLDYIHRAATFGLVEQDGKLACVRVDRGEGGYFDLPGGAVDGEESEQQALVREFAEETGLIVEPEDRLTEAAQYFRRTDGSPAVSGPCGSPASTPRPSASPITNWSGWTRWRPSPACATKLTPGPW